MARLSQVALDALLAVVAFAVVVGYAGVAGVEPRPAPAGGGAVAAVAVELAALVGLSEERYDRLRAVWERPAVRVGTTGVAAAVGGVAAGVAPAPAVSFAGGALLAYLAVLAVVLARRRAS